MIYAIGDVHGHLDLLAALFDSIFGQLQPSDTLVLLGDYIDRGPDSRGVLEVLTNLELQSQVIALKGNHEDLALRAVHGFRPTWDDHGLIVANSDPVRPWLMEGGGATLGSYGLDVESSRDEEFARWPTIVPRSHWNFLDRCLIEWKAENWWFVHAGILPKGMTWEYDGLGLDPRLWVREPFLSHTGAFDGRRVVFGHTPQSSERPLIQPNKLGIDTGVAYGGPLTAACLEENGVIAGFIQSSESGVTFLET